jgi:hypothetical protein
MYPSLRPLNVRILNLNLHLCHLFDLFELYIYIYNYNIEIVNTHVRMHSCTAVKPYTIIKGRKIVQLLYNGTRKFLETAAAPTGCAAHI